MKKLIRIMICAVLTVSGLARAGLKTEAREDYSDYYPMSCYAYEVDVVDGNGMFESRGCYDDFDTAKSEMKKLGQDGVLRHPSSYSPSKVIAVSAGTAYSYPQRSGSNTGRIYQSADYSPSLKNTYITVHREMHYEDTIAYDPYSGNGKIHVVVNGFDGYMDLRNADIIPMRFMNDHMKIWLGGNSEYNYEEPFSTYVYQGYFKVEQNGNYKDLVYHCRSGYSDDEPVEWIFAIAPAAGWMETGDVYYSKDGFTFFKDQYYQEEAGTYYSYYQFEPLRTRSYIPAEVYNIYLQKKNRTGGQLWDTGGIFLAAQEEFGINALLVFAMACLESGYGTSQFAVQRNNLFGWSAFDSAPGMASYFSSVEQGIREHMGINLREYVSVNDARFFGSHLGNKGSGINVKYAGDNYWGMKIAALAYDIDKCSKNYDGTLTDFNTSVLGVVAHDYNVNVRASNTTESAILYNTTFGDYDVYQQNFMVSVLGEKDGWYQVQSNNYLENGAVKFISGLGFETWDWENFRGWIRSDLVTILNSDGSLPAAASPKKTEKDLVRTLDNVSLGNDSVLSLSGIAFIKGMNAGASSDISVQVKAVNMESGEETPVTASMSDVDGFSFGDGYEYRRIGWSAGIDLSGLGEGNYYLSLSLNNGGTSAEKILISNKEAADQAPRYIGDHLVRVFADPLSNYRMEISIERSDLDYSVINKPTRRSSVFGGTIGLEGSVLTIDGFGIIADTYLNEADHPSHTLILSDSYGTSLRINADTKACAVDLAAMRGSEYTADRACFDVRYDLAGLSSGTYRLYLDEKTDDARDLFEIYNIRDPEPLEASDGNRTYRIFTTGTRNRYILEIG